MAAEDFAKLNKLLARSDVSIDLIESMVKAFPQLEEAYNTRLAQDVPLFAEQGRIDLLEKAKERGFLENKKHNMALFAEHATTPEVSSWILTETNAIESGDVITERSLTVYKIELILRNVPLPKEDRMALANVAFERLEKYTLELLDMYRSKMKASSKYPLVHAYFEVSRRPEISSLHFPNEENLAEAEHELKAMAWILYNTDKTYPDEKIFSEFNVEGKTGNEVILKAIVEEYKRVYLKK